MPDTAPVLIVCSEPAQSDTTIEILRRIGLDFLLCTSLTDARALVERQVFQFVLCADELPDCNLRTAIRVLSASTGGIPVLVLSHLAIGMRTCALSRQELLTISPALRSRSKRSALCAWRFPKIPRHAALPKPPLDFFAPCADT